MGNNSMERRVQDLEGDVGNIQTLIIIVVVSAIIVFIAWVGFSFGKVA